MAGGFALIKGLTKEKGKPSKESFGKAVLAGIGKGGDKKKKKTRREEALKDDD